AGGARGPGRALPPEPYRLACEGWAVTASALRQGSKERSRSAPAGEGRPEGARRRLAAGASGACTAAGLGLAVVTVLVTAGWIAAPHVGLGLVGVVRTAAVLWLVGHHVAVQVHGAGRIGMLPLGLVALPGALLWRGGPSGRRRVPGTGGQAPAAAAAP